MTTNDAAADSPPRPDDAPRTTWPQRIALLAFGALLLVVLELLLHAFGFGGHRPLLIPLEPDARADAPAAPTLHRINPAVVDAFFQRGADGIKGDMRVERVLVPKPADRLRVVFLGESSVQGFPQPRNLTAAAFLARLLEETVAVGSDGDKPQIEVINLGVTGVASFPIRQIGARAIAELEPDLVLLYAAHNEFFGAAGQASRQAMGGRVDAMRLTYALRGLAITQALEPLAAALRGGDDPAASPPSTEASADAADAEDASNAEPPAAARARQLIQVMAARDVPLNSPLRAAARRALTRNLGDVVGFAQRRDVPVVLATVASNVRDLVPVTSSTVDLTSADVDALVARLPDWRARAAAALDLAELRSWAARAPSHAEVHYHLARALRIANDRATANVHFRRARDLDLSPWRAPAALNDGLRALARDRGVPLADVDAAFADALPNEGGAPGWDLFDDHVHPSLRGQIVLAQTLFDAVAAHGLLPLDAEAAAAARARPWQMLAQQQAARPLDRYRIVRMMATLFRGPPFGLVNGAARTFLERQAARGRARMTPVERRGVDRWRAATARAGAPLPITPVVAAARLRPADAAADGAEAQAPLDRAALAAETYAAIRATPNFDDRRIAAYLLADLAAARAGNLDRAQLARHLAEARRIETLLGQPSALLDRALAGLLALASDADDAAFHDQRARDAADALPADRAVWYDELPARDALPAWRDAAATDAASTARDDATPASDSETEAGT